MDLISIEAAEAKRYWLYPLLGTDNRAYLPEARTHAQRLECQRLS